MSSTIYDRQTILRVEKNIEDVRFHVSRMLSAAAIKHNENNYYEDEYLWQIELLGFPLELYMMSNFFIDNVLTGRDEMDFLSKEFASIKYPNNYYKDIRKNSIGSSNLLLFDTENSFDREALNLVATQITGYFGGDIQYAAEPPYDPVIVESVPLVKNENPLDRIEELLLIN